jgi:hypothetical protein
MPTTNSRDPLSQALDFIVQSLTSGNETASIYITAATGTVTDPNTSQTIDIFPGDCIVTYRFGDKQIAETYYDTTLTDSIVGLKAKLDSSLPPDLVQVSSEGPKNCVEARLIPAEINEMLDYADASRLLGISENEFINNMKCVNAIGSENKLASPGMIYAIANRLSLSQNSISKRYSCFKLTRHLADQQHI